MINKFYAALALCGIVTLLLAACGSTSPNPGAASTQVHMNDSNFVQPSITIKKGQSITLVADTLTAHVIANGTWENGTAKSAREQGAPTVANITVGGDSSTSIGPFNSAGSFKLYCTIHAGMNLTVIVQ